MSTVADSGRAAVGFEGKNDGRLASLDAFRGFTIAAMVLVNNPGSWDHVYGPLDHAQWNGCTFTDLIFPFFLFISGVSLALSLGRFAQAGTDRIPILRKLLRRAALIFLIGLALNLVPSFDFSTVRIPGVLQRIGLCTALAAPIVLFFSWRKQLLWILTLLSAYTVAMLWVPVPGGAAGVLEPSLDMGAYLDRLVLHGHLWSKSKTWDPEGLLSTLPALSNMLIGVLIGRWLRHAAGSASASPRLVVYRAATFACLGISLVCAGVMLDRFLIPINKSLWTTSYCLYTAGLSTLVLGCFDYLLDSTYPGAKAIFRRVAFPLTVYGHNALFIFALSSLVAKTLNFVQVTGPAGVPAPLKSAVYAQLHLFGLAEIDTSLLYAILFNVLMFSVAWGMWRRRWFLKV